MNNEEKLRTALVALVGCDDSLFQLEVMKHALISEAPDNEDAQVCAAAIQVLIDTHPATAVDNG